MSDKKFQPFQIARNSGIHKKSPSISPKHQEKPETLKSHQANKTV